MRSTPQPAADHGISLVEILVSVTILTVALGAFASTVVQAMQAVGQDELRVRATQCAADLLESVRVLPWNQVGFYSGDAGYQGTVGGDSTVELGTTRPPGAAAPLPTSTTTCAGTDYTTTMSIVWKDDPTRPAPPAVDPDPNDYKEITATLDWTYRDRPHQVVQVMVRQPTLDEVDAANDGGAPGAASCTPGEIVNFDISPNFVEITPSGNTADAVTVTVDMCTATSQVLLTPTPLSQRSMVEVAGSGGTQFTVDDFPAGTTAFDPGTYTWSISTTGGDGSDSDSAEIQFAEQSTDVLAVQSLTVSPHSTICVASTNQRTFVATTMEAYVTGADPGDNVSFSWTSKSGTATATLVASDASGTRWQGTLPADHQLQDPTTTVTVRVERISDGLQVSEAFVTDVQRRSDGGACT